MFSRFFRKLDFSTLLFFITASIAIWLQTFIKPVFYPSSLDTVKMPLYELLTVLFPTNNLIASISAFTITVITGIYILNINGRYQIVRQRTYMPLFFYVIISSAVLPIQRVSPVLPASLLLVLSLDYLLAIYESKTPIDKIFKSSLILSTASLFYAPLIFLIVWLLFGIFILSRVTFRNVSALIIGFSIPWLLLIFYYYWFNKDVSGIWELVKWNLTSKTIDSYNHTLPLILVITLFPATLFSILRIFRNFSTQKVSIVKFQMIILWLLAFTILFFWLIPQCSFELLYFLAIPLSLFLSAYIANAKSKFWPEFSIWVIIAGIIILQIL